jgi:hypothetical protein
MPYHHFQVFSLKINFFASSLLKALNKYAWLFIYCIFNIIIPLSVPVMLRLKAILLLNSYRLKQLVSFARFLSLYYQIKQL